MMAPEMKEQVLIYAWSRFSFMLFWIQISNWTFQIALILATFQNCTDLAARNEAAGTLYKVKREWTYFVMFYIFKNDKNHIQPFPGGNQEGVAAGNMTNSLVDLKI